jgi:uncharacterized protein (TIGR03437 family)
MRIKRTLRSVLPILFILAAGIFAWKTFQPIHVSAATPWTLIGWNDLGMHFLDADYSVFAILPPNNTIHAQLIDSTGKLVKSAAGVQVTYEAVADPAGSINTTSRGKTNFWTFANMFAAGLAIDTGLKGSTMPGAANQPQSMNFDGAYNWFSAEGIPLIPYDDNWNKNTYPMMKLVARDSGGAILASTRIVLPVSDEMDCRSCHASGVATTAKPAQGWVYDSNPDRDYKLNILRKHDEKQLRSQVYLAALTTSGYSSDGLYATAAAGQPVLCAQCHSTNALGTAGIGGIPSLTFSMHSFHAAQPDPATGITLDDATNRSACYSCHPGSTTRFLRGAMGNSVAADGTMAMQCQSCHGNMSAVGGAERQGWLNEPSCQSCHTGNAVATRGQLRNTSVFDASGAVRAAVDTTFATTANQPAAGLNLYRFSTGHGGLLCEACHGSTHAESISSQPNDNLQSIDTQGFAGALGECTACHRSGISTTTGGPHGMHPVGAPWVTGHTNTARNAAPCQVCHGTNYRGTVLSMAFTSRTLQLARTGPLQMFRGYIVTCYACHNGATGSGSAPASAKVSNTSSTATSGQSATIPITISGSGTLRIVSQPQGGTASVSGSSIVYRAYPDFEGDDKVSYAAFNGSNDSNLGTAAVTVTAAIRPNFTAAGTANSASYAAGSISPGMLVTMFGSGLGPANLATLRLNSGGFLQRSLEGTRVLFNGLTAPMVYTSAGQLAAVVPYGIAGQQSVNVVVEYNGIQSRAVSVPVVSAAPGIFTSNASGRGQAKAANQDGSLNSSASPAAAGSILTFYATGEGVLTPTLPDGILTAPPLSKPVLSVGVKIGGQTAQVQYAGVAPGLTAGVMQVNATVPAGAGSGAAELLVTVGTASSPAGVTIQLK